MHSSASIFFGSSDLVTWLAYRPTSSCALAACANHEEGGEEGDAGQVGSSFSFLFRCSNALICDGGHQRIYRFPWRNPSPRSVGRPLASMPRWQNRPRKNQNQDTPTGTEGTPACEPFSPNLGLWNINMFGLMLFSSQAVPKDQDASRRSNLWREWQCTGIGAENVCSEFGERNLHVSRSRLEFCNRVQLTASTSNGYATMGSNSESTGRALCENSQGLVARLCGLTRHVPDLDGSLAFRKEPQ